MNSQKKMQKTFESHFLPKKTNFEPQKIETRVGERGIKFSGGQLQRIGIARALYNEPDLLILDEPTSSLDRKTEEQFIEVVKKISVNQTLIIISHRQSILGFCDKIYKIENGKLMEEKNV